MVKLINLTPHSIVLRNNDGEDTVIEPSGTIARVSNAPSLKFEQIEGISVPVFAPDEMGEVENLPEPEDETFYLVSGMVGAACMGRDDVLVPGTGPQDGAIRNEKGHIVAVTRLKRV